MLRRDVNELVRLRDGLIFTYKRDDFLGEYVPIWIVLLFGLFSENVDVWCPEEARSGRDDDEKEFA